MKQSGIHAREWISPAAVTYVMNELVTFYNDNFKLADQVDWYILPVANPDGYVHTWTKVKTCSIITSITTCKLLDKLDVFQYQFSNDTLSTSLNG